MASQTDHLDWRVIILFPLVLFVPWMGLVLVLTWRGQPGVVCLTPVAWLLAAALGRAVASYTPSAGRGLRLRAAGLAGALLGLLQGLLFAVIGLTGLPVRPDELPGWVGVIIAVGVGGVLAGGGLALMVAALAERTYSPRPE